MYYDNKTRKFYDSEYDTCFGNERKMPQVNTNEFDGLVVVQEQPTKQNKCNDDRLNFDVFK